ncbi:MAG TPA: hypothetical protein GXZ26_07685 [Firmicutes bacterium]|nr:hypothetical protein [Bacillota bacterium]
MNSAIDRRPEVADGQDRKMNHREKKIDGWWLFFSNLFYVKIESGRRSHV